MRHINLDMLAEEMSQRADFPLPVEQAKAFAKEALGRTLKIIKESKGRIAIRHCDLLQAYRTFDKKEAILNQMDVNEVQEHKNTIRPYSK